ncbi:MAG TPA: hypothetical protein VEW42_04320 [Candidatus Eisenbacteria bacterium]|nr:hypothetical protein [Candidatus Eisenbacteria bacterium]
MSEHNIKSILALLILLVAFSILLIFSTNKDALMAPGVFPLFMTLATVGLGLLVGLLFLVNNSHHNPVKAKKVVSRSKVSKKKRK